MHPLRSVMWDLTLVFPSRFRVIYTPSWTIILYTLWCTSLRLVVWLGNLLFSHSFNSLAIRVWASGLYVDLELFSFVLGTLWKVFLLWVVPRDLLTTPCCGSFPYCAGICCPYPCFWRVLVAIASHSG